MDASSQEITLLLEKWRAGEDQAAAQLFPLVLHELRRIAAALMSRERPGHTLQPTALVNELFLRLASDRSKNWTDRAHFLAVSARAMRQVLVDHARRGKRTKRGGGRTQVALPDDLAAQTVDLVGLLQWDQLLTQLESFDPRSARMVELRWFAGLEGAEIAAVLGISEKTVKRDWSMTRAWLKARIKGLKADDSTGLGET